MNDILKNIELYEEGLILLIDKPLDWTSFDVVKKIRSLLRVKKVGHAGTLDPKATGLLIVCTGRKTKSISNFIDLEKEYYGTCELGIRTPSFDTETEVSEHKDFSSITENQIIETAKQFLGKQLQLPPMYSALKYCGKPLYQYAREERVVARTERGIEISKFDILDIRNQFVDFRVVCSKGTYIRSLVDEFGMRLECLATLKILRRTRIGEHHIDNAMSIQQLGSRWTPNIKDVSDRYEYCQAN